MANGVIIPPSSVGVKYVSIPYTFESSLAANGKMGISLTSYLPSGAKPLSVVGEGIALANILLEVKNYSSENYIRVIALDTGISANTSVTFKVYYIE